MDLMMFVPNMPTLPNIQRMPCLVHNCKEPMEQDKLYELMPGNTPLMKIRRLLLQIRIVSWKHPFTRWCLKSTTVVNYEITRHLRTYPRMIHPFSIFRICWESIMVVFSLLALIITPAFLAFPINTESNVDVFDYVMDTVFIMDITIWFFTGYYDYQTKIVVLDPKIVARSYFKGYFYMDVLPAMPLELVNHVIYESFFIEMLSILRIFRIRIIIVYSRRLRYVYNLTFERYKLMEMGVIILLVVHWAACMEYYIPAIVAQSFGYNNESWVHSDYMQKKQSDGKKYLACLNRATIALVCSAHYIRVRTPEDIGLNLILSIFGTFGFIYILAQVLQLMISFDSTYKRHLKQLEQLEEYMRYKELPDALQRRLVIYFNYRNRKGFERHKQIINLVSPYLREQLILHNYLRMLNSVELFTRVPQPLISQLAAALRSEIYLANDIITKAGTAGDSLYFVASGTVAVYTTAKKEVCHLEDGAHFGEIALVMENEHRIATVIAIETCEIYILHRSDFRKVIMNYPDLEHHLRNFALELLEKTVVLEEACTMEDATPSHINISNIRSKKRDSTSTMS